MIVTVHGHGILADWLGAKPRPIALPAGSILDEMKKIIHGLLVQRTPNALKTGSIDAFFDQLLVTVNGEIVVAGNAPRVLHQGDEIRLHVLMVGG